MFCFLICIKDVEIILIKFLHLLHQLAILLLSIYLIFSLEFLLFNLFQQILIFLLFSILLHHVHQILRIFFNLLLFQSGSYPLTQQASQFNAEHAFERVVDVLAHVEGAGTAVGLSFGEPGAAPFVKLIFETNELARFFAEKSGM